MVLLSKINITNIERTHNPKIFKITADSEDPLEKTFLESMGNKLIGKYLSISSKSDTKANLSNIFAELAINTNISHPNCNSAVGVTSDRNNIILLFKKLEFNLERKNNFSLEKIKSNIKSLVSGVKYLHSRRIIHGNIKPSNVLFGRFDNLKITDYSHSALIISDDKSRFTSKMYAKNYRPPEVWNSDEWGFSSDIWALGCTIYYMIYGEHLFPFQDSDEAYISCLDSWSSREKNPIGDSVELSHEWSNTNLFMLNNLILMMCNPDESKRPSIFDISKQLDEEFEYSLPLSCSPESVCRYIELDRCDGIISCTYDDSKYVSPAKDKLIELLIDEQREFAYLVMCIYEKISFIPEFSLDTFNLSVILACKITKTECDIHVSSRYVSIIKNFIKNGMYEFFEWKRYFQDN